MKEVTFYECEFCNASFRTKTDAKDHELLHKELIGVHAKHYEPLSKYPTEVELRFRLGEKKTTLETYYHTDMVYKAIDLARSPEWARYDRYRVVSEAEKCFKDARGVI